MVGVGPFSISVVKVAFAILIAWILTRLLAKRITNVSHKLSGSILLDGVLCGVVAARIGYVIVWWDEYIYRPVSILAIGDGGYIWWLGAIASFLFVVWRARAVMLPLQPILSGLTAGLLVWFLVGVVINHLYKLPSLPAVELQSIESQPVALESYLGKPVVVNLWASWCPPCRREMPAFERAQKELTEVNVLMINQGESADQAIDFLKAEGLELDNVLLDYSSNMMHIMGSKGLPTTLFFDYKGNLLDSHMGEITLPALKDKVQRNFK